jgi:NAD(P)-dependent dehydrogenase (short-subunit alcohol dehydrogenase family)
VVDGPAHHPHTRSPLIPEDPVNLFGTYWMAQAAARVMSPGASIINIGSIAGFTTARLPQAAYISSKTALIGLTRDLAQQWSGRKGIRVNLLAPGIFPTDMSDQFPPGYVEQITADRIPMGRTGLVEEVVSSLIFLASDASSYVTGSVLPVDGGLLVT